MLKYVKDLDCVEKCCIFTLNLKIRDMRTVTLKMKDLLNDTIVERTIDALNAYSNGSVCWELRGEAEQRKNLESWIDERGNDQHDTLLELISWEFNN